MELLRTTNAPRLVVQQMAERSGELADSRRARTVHRASEFWQSLEGVDALGYAVQQSTRQSTVEALSDSPSDHAGQSPQGFSTVTRGTGCEAAWSSALWRQDMRQLINQAGGVPRTDYPGETRFLAAFQRLLDQPFTTLYQDAAAPVTIRQSTDSADATQGYAVNAAPWPVTVVLQMPLPESPGGMQDPAGPKFTELTWRNVVTGQAITALPVSKSPTPGSTPVLAAVAGVRETTDNAGIGPAANLDGRLKPAGLSRGTTSVAQITLDLPPHSLAVWTGPAIALEGVSILEPTPTVASWLQAVRESLFRRLRQAATNASPLAELQNSGFDAQPNAGIKAANSAVNTAALSGWTHGQLKVGQVVTGDTEVVHSGTQSLRLANPDGVVWVRSASLPPPATGRLSITAWVKNHPQRPAASLRLAIDGQTTQGPPYYRFAEIPLEATVEVESSSTQGWQPVAVHFDDLPEEGLVSVRVGFDLMQSGELWIDSVQCFDRWFDVNDQKVLSNRLGLATFSLENKKNLWAAQQALDDYWLRFLLTYVPDPNQLVEAGQRSQDVPPTDPRLRNARGRRFLPLR
jgi:hypothetical protein